MNTRKVTVTLTPKTGDRTTTLERSVINYWANYWGSLKVSSYAGVVEPFQGVQRRMVLVFFFCFAIAIFDLVHDVEAIDSLYLLLTTSDNLF